MSDVDRWKRADELEDFRDSTEVTGCVNYKCISGPRVARHIILITVNIPSGAHAGCNANSMPTMLCQFRYKCIIRRRVYLCCKLSTQS